MGVKQRDANDEILQGFGFSILWVDRGGETHTRGANGLPVFRFSILWVDRGGETGRSRSRWHGGTKFQYPLGGSWG